MNLKQILVLGAIIGFISAFVMVPLSHDLFTAHIAIPAVIGLVGGIAAVQIMKKRRS